MAYQHAEYCYENNDHVGDIFVLIFFCICACEEAQYSQNFLFLILLCWRSTDMSNHHVLRVIINCQWTFLQIMKTYVLFLLTQN